jgi:hypothetical protein
MKSALTLSEVSVLITFRESSGEEPSAANRSDRTRNPFTEKELLLGASG